MIERLGAEPILLLRSAELGESVIWKRQEALPGKKNAAAKVNRMAEIVPGSNWDSVNFIATCNKAGSSRSRSPQTISLQACQGWLRNT